MRRSTTQASRRRASILACALIAAGLGWIALTAAAPALAQLPRLVPDKADLVVVRKSVKMTKAAQQKAAEKK